MEDSRGAIKGNQNIADVYISLNKKIKARNYLQRALKLAETTKDTILFKDIYQSLSRLDSAEGNFKLAAFCFAILIIVLLDVVVPFEILLPVKIPVALYFTSR